MAMLEKGEKRSISEKLDDRLTGILYGSREQGAQQQSAAFLTHTFPRSGGGWVTGGSGLLNALPPQQVARGEDLSATIESKIATGSS